MITSAESEATVVLANAQRLRRQRTLLAGAIYAVCIALLLLLRWQGSVYLNDVALVAIIGSALLANLGFLWWIASGRNLSRRDPSLTKPQMLFATLWSLVPLYLNPNLRAEILLFYLCAFFFGSFRLQRQDFLQIVLVALCGYLGIMALDVYNETAGVSLQQNLVRFVMLTVVLLIQSVLGGHIYDMRKQLRLQHQALQQAHEQISHQAAFDALTGLHNRRFLMEALLREEARARRRGSQFSIIMCDLDHFKAINDRYGHLAGDAVLKTAAEALKQHLRTADWLAHGGDELVARYGGEEFAILLPDTDLEGSRLCAERLRNALRNAHQSTLPEGQQMTGSFGVAQYRAGDQLRDLLARADSALYEAKHNGRDRVVVAT